MRNSKCNYVSVQKENQVEESDSLRHFVAMVFELLFECLQSSPLDPSLISRPRAHALGFCKRALSPRWVAD